MRYPVYDVVTGRKMADSELYGRGSGMRFTGPELHTVLSWLAGRGFQITDCHGFGAGLRYPGSHSRKSWHRLRDGDGFGLGADVNWPGPSGPRERAELLAAIPTLDRIGIGWMFARDGYVPRHVDHLHLDVGPIGRSGGPAPNYGRFLARHRADPADLLLPKVPRKPRRLLARPGARGARVHAAQAAAGAPRDGIYGEATEAAVRKLQRRLKVTADGVYGPATGRAALLTIEPIRRGDRHPYIATVQYVALETIATRDSLDGIYGRNTEAGVKATQRWAGVTADGVVGPRTIERIIR